MPARIVRMQLRLRSHLIGLVLIAILPVLSFAGITVWLLAEQQSREARWNLRSTTRALNSAIDERVSTLLAALKVIAASEDLTSSNLSEFYARLQRAARSEKGWQAITLVGPDGVPVFHSNFPRGTKLPSLGSDEFFQRAVATKSPSVSGYRIGRASGLPVVTVAVPIMRGEKVYYVLTGSLLIEHLGSLMPFQNLPAGWTAALLDRDATILARSRDAEKYVGKKATAELAKQSRAEIEAMFEDVTQEGNPALGTFSRSSLTGWTMVLAFPESALRMQTHQVFGFVLSGGVILLLTGIILASLYGRRISRPIVALSRAAAALGRGEPVEPVPSAVSEVNSVADALRQAARERDLTERALRATNAQAREAIAQRDTFLSVASHELKTPVTSLLLQLQLLQRRLKAHGEAAFLPELLRPADIMYAQVKRLTRLVDELLDVSRIASGRLELHPESLDLAEFLRGVAVHFEGESARTGSSLELDLAAEIPGAWDPHRLDHIVTNLISNAFKYGGGKPIHVSARASEHEVVLTVRDHGIGIAAEHHERIFQRFERAVGSQHYGGLGLGLWIVQRLVTAMNGSIRVESNPGEGATFQVTLPRETKPGPAVEFGASPPVA